MHMEVAKFKNKTISSLSTRASHGFDMHREVAKFKNKTRSYPFKSGYKIHELGFN